MSKHKKPRSAGIVFYRNHPKLGLEYLLQRRKYKQTEYWEDLGGKREDGETLKQTAAREASEESNGAFLGDISIYKYNSLIPACTSLILRLMAIKCTAFIHKKIGYALYLVQIPYELSEVDFGTKEIHPKWDIHRTISWLHHSEFSEMPRKSIHPRIRHFHNCLQHIVI